MQDEDAVQEVYQAPLQASQAESVQVHFGALQAQKMVRLERRSRQIPLGSRLPSLLGDVQTLQEL